MKIAIICDQIGGGGAFREIKSLAKVFDAHIYAGRGINSESTITNEDFKTLNIKRILGKMHRSGLVTILYTIYKFRNISIKENYDLYIFIGNHCIGLADKLKPNIWYCNTPDRGLYLGKENPNERSIKARIFNILFFKFFYNYDQYYAKRFNIIIAISNTVRERIFKAYGKNDMFNKEIKIIYPPVDVKQFKWKEQEDYYLSTARIAPYKRVSLIVEAFKKMPDKKLIVISTGPQLEDIKKSIKGYSNIVLQGRVTDKELKELIGNCIATIYIPYEEDFGISPIEGMAAGKPCIGVEEGGLRETIIHNKTGYLCPSNPKVDDLIKAVEFMSTSKALIMRKDCEEWSKKFSKEVFIERMSKLINKIYLENKNNKHKNI